MFIPASSQNQAAIGFIGLGNMGRWMAKNLIDKGNQVNYKTMIDKSNEGNQANEQTIYELSQGNLYTGGRGWYLMCSCTQNMG